MTSTGRERLARLPRHRLLAEFSLWSADLARLADDVARVDPHVDIYHVDVADGHFAPAMLYFPDLLARVRSLTDKLIHVHLMVADSILLAQIDQFIEAGADLISVHVENETAIEAALALLEERSVAAGVVLRVETPIERVEPFLDRVAFVTLLGTAIGVKGQSLAKEAPDRIAQARALVHAAGRDETIIVAADGGIRDNTVPLLRTAGAETIVMGSLAFGAPDLATRIAWVHGLQGP